MPVPHDPADRAETLLNLLASGLNLDRICAMPDWPSRPTLRKWARQDPALAAAMAEGARRRGQRERHPFEPEVAERLLHRLRLGDPLSRLLRQPGWPDRRALNAWKRQSPAFAAELEAAKDFAGLDRRRYGRRRSRMRFDQSVADHLMLAVLRGATLPDLGRDPALPSAKGVERWRKADPEFDAALRAALKIGHKARGRTRAQALCSPEFIQRIGRRIAAGASLHSLGREQGMPSLTTLYKWAREHPAFAAEVAQASEFRNQMLADQAGALAERLAPTDPATARRAVRAIHKALGQMRPHPGAGRRG